MAKTYTAPQKSQALLGSINDLLKQATPINIKLLGATAIFKLPGGQIYFESDLDLDTDGSQYAKQDPTGQSGTSLQWTGGKAVDPDVTPFFVLPVKGFHEKLGVKLGDIAVVIYGDKMSYAIFADRGPKNKLGEGSIELHRRLGHETIVNGKLHNVGIDGEVITIVFPGSGTGKALNNGDIAYAGEDLFSKLKTGAKSLVREKLLEELEKLLVYEIEEKNIKLKIHPEIVTEKDIFNYTPEFVIDYNLIPFVIDVDVNHAKYENETIQKIADGLRYVNAEFSVAVNDHTAEVESLDHRTEMAELADWYVEKYKQEIIKYYKTMVEIYRPKIKEQRIKALEEELRNLRKS